MMKLSSVLALSFLLASTTASGQQPASPDPVAPTATVPKICQYVVSAEPGTKPYQLCLTRAEWDAKKLADAKDANRMICHYEETPGTRLRSQKTCMTAGEWAEQRRLEREAVDKLQQSVCVPGAGC